MFRSPAEEGEDTGTGSGSCPRRPRYAVGDEVEVLFTGPGFRGSRFEATITARLQASSRYEVLYSELLVRRGGPRLREVVAASDVRPRPPLSATVGRNIELFGLVEAYNNDGWWPGVVSDIRPKRRGNQKTWFTVSLPRFREVVELPASRVRPRREFVYGIWIDAQEVLREIPQYAEGSHVQVMCDKQGRVWKPATVKKMVGITNYVVSYANEENSTEVLHTHFIRPESIPDKVKLEPYSSIPNKRERKENAETEGLIMWHPLNLRQDTARSLLKNVTNMEITSEKHVSTVKKLESEREGLGFRVSKEKEQLLEASAVETLISTPCDGKGKHSLPKAHASKRKGLLSDSSINDIIEIGSKSSCVHIVISDDSGYGNFIEISDDSGYNSNRKKRRMNPPDEELHFNHLIHNNQASCSLSSLRKAHNPHHDILLGASRHSEEHAFRNLLSQSMVPLASSQDPSHKDGGQRISLRGCQVQEFLRRNETDEPRLLNQCDSENVSMTIDDSAAGGGNHEMCQKVTEVNNWVSGTSNEGADTGLTNPRISHQKTVDQSYDGPFPIGKLEPFSRQQDFVGDLLCMEVLKNHKIDIESKKTRISPEEVAAFRIGNSEPPSSGQKGVNVSIEAPNDNKMEIENERMGMSLAAVEGFHLETLTEIASVSYPECNASSQHPWVFATTSLLLLPTNKMEIFKKLPQIPHFREAWNCPRELREGRALGLMVCFANMAYSIKNMKIQDEPRLYQEKMSTLLNLEENGFEVAPLKFHLHNLLCSRYHQINLKSRKARLDNEILEIEARNCGLEQRLKLLDMCVMGMEETRYEEMKASIDMQKTENCSSITKLQVDLCQVEESLMSAEADFCSIATAPWQSDVGPLLP